MGALEDYIYQELRKEFQKKLDENSCPDCEILFIQTQRGTIMCPICGHKPNQGDTNERYRADR